MNQIAYAEATSRFIDAAHGVIVVDGKPLDELLDTWWPGQSLAGLIPALVTGLPNPEEEALIWSRALPPADARSVAPILLCPDDLDFSCTVVVAEVTTDASSVTWSRVGLDTGAAGPPSAIGSPVEWSSAIKPLVFDRLAYEAVLDCFRRARPWYAPASRGRD